MNPILFMFILSRDTCINLRSLKKLIHFNICCIKSFHAWFDIKIKYGKIHFHKITYDRVTITFLCEILVLKSYIKKIELEMQIKKKKSKMSDEIYLGNDACVYNV